MESASSLLSFRMKRFAVVGKNRNKDISLERKMQNLGFVLDKKKPEFVVSVGGDGTFLHSERLYPGVPKLLSRDSVICQKCGNMLLGSMLKRIAAGKHRIRKYNKVEATVAGKKLLATNEIIIRNHFPGHAIRFNVLINGKSLGPAMIGDGIVVSSVYGSTAYFKSITGKSFASGIGVAFNNLTLRRKHLFLPANSRVVFKLVRGLAVVSADNNPKSILISQGKCVSVKQSSKVTRIVAI